MEREQSAFQSDTELTASRHNQIQPDKNGSASAEQSISITAAPFWQDYTHLSGRSFENKQSVESESNASQDYFALTGREP